MDQSRRARLTSLVVSTLVVTLSVAFIALHISSASDGTRLQPGQPDWLPNGVQVTQLRTQSDGLRTGDVVVAVDGRTMESWADGLFHRPVPSSHAGREQTVVYTVVRDGTLVDVPVKPEAYPLGAVLREDWGTILLALVFEAVAVFVFIRRPADRAAQVLLVGSSSLVGATTWSFGVQIGDLTGWWGFWLYIATSLGAYSIFWIAFLHFALRFPRTHPIVTRWPRVIPTMYLAPIAGYALFFVMSRMLAANTLVWIGLWLPAEGVLAFVYIVLMMIAMLSQYRSSRDATTRQKIRWVVFAAVLSSGGGLLLWVIPVDVLGRQIISTNMLGLLALPVPLAMAIAILRHQLFDIDIIIRRTLIYGTLTATLAGLYFAVVLTAQVLGQRLTGQAQPPAWLIVVTTLVVAALFTPMRRRIQRSIDRRFYRGKYDAARTIEAFSVILRTKLDLSELSESLVGVVEETMRPAHVSIWMRKPPAADRGHTQ